jgi:hypothetical protein
MRRMVGKAPFGITTTENRMAQRQYIFHPAKLIHSAFTATTNELGLKLITTKMAQPIRS